jgi:HK97 family phage major capsid protein
MRATDAMLTRYAGEIDQQQKFLDSLVQAAESDSRDLSEQEMELVTRAQTRISEVSKLIEPLQEAQRIASQSTTRLTEIADYMRERVDETPRQVEYRSAGEYVLDYWRTALGEPKAKERMEVYNRAASHQTTGDNPGLLPTPIVGPVVSFIDANRPLVTQLGPRQVPGATWSRPKVTQHTSVALQSAEKGELVSQKMTITKIAGAVATYGGYVNISRQNIDFTQPSILDTVINDLAAQYAIQTETAACAYFVTNSTAGTVLPTGPVTGDEIAAAIWAAVGSIYGAVKGVGRVFALISPSMLGLIGPIFPPINPVSAQGSGFAASNFSSGLVGQIGGVPVYCSGALATNTMLVVSTAAAEVYEDRIGSLQVVEPSVLGLQVAYAGYFTPLSIDTGGVVKIVKTP